MVTPRVATCAGFLEQATAKTIKASPYVQEAVEFWKALQSVSCVEDLVKMRPLRVQLLAAAGFSDKAQNYFTETELTKALETTINNGKAVSDFRIDVFARFLLTRGDSLGGKMRNVTGAEAGKRLSGVIVAALEKLGKRFDIAKSKTGKVQQIFWDGRRIVFDVKSPLVGKNIDVILLKSSSPALDKTAMLKLQELHLSLGELKGGIDPAGSDEHWKTAGTTLARIRAAFNPCPPLFFVGAAIETAMAEEIFRDLKSGRLAYAANLTDNGQLCDLADWLVQI